MQIGSKAATTMVTLAGAVGVGAGAAAASQFVKPKPINFQAGAVVSLGGAGMTSIAIAKAVSSSHVPTGTSLAAAATTAVGGALLGLGLISASRS